MAVKNCFIRGSVVRYVQLPAENVDTQLLEDATRRGPYFRQRKTYIPTNESDLQRLSARLNDESRVRNPNTSVAAYATFTHVQRCVRSPVKECRLPAYETRPTYMILDRHEARPSMAVFSYM